MFLLDLQYNDRTRFPDNWSIDARIDYLRARFQREGFVVRGVSHVPPDPFQADVALMPDMIVDEC